MKLHAHLDWESRDCDGRYSGTSATVINPDESEYDFEIRMLGSRISWPSSYEGPVEISLHVLESGKHQIVSRQDTEEGYSNAAITFCEDECDVGKTGFRDYTAESMGY